MKAAVVHAYGSPDVLKYEDHADPILKPGEVLIRLAATSVNPIDIKRRSGAMKNLFPIHFPEILGVDVAGTIAKLGANVQGWSVGDRVFAMASHAYAELCAVNASTLAKVPEGMDLVDAAAIPLVVTTGAELITEGTAIKPGQTVLVTGALGSVGRSAVFTAKSIGAKVIAAVRTKQLSQAANIGADSVIAVDDDSAIAKLPALDAVADFVGGPTADKLLPKLKQGGTFASAVGPPPSIKNFPTIKFVPFGAHPDAATLTKMSTAIRQGKLTIPITKKFPLKETASAHAAIEQGLSGKVVLVV